MSDLLGDMQKARSKVYWSEESSCMEETYGTVQRALDGLDGVIRRALKALAQIDHPVGQKDEVHFDMAWRVLAGASLLSSPSHPEDSA